MMHYFYYFSFLLLFNFFIFRPANANGEDFFINQNSSGSGRGTSSLDCLNIGFLNNSTNWSSPIKLPGKIGPGDNIHLVGIITNSITVGASGTTSNYINIYFEPYAILSSPAWTYTGAINITSKSNIVIDGKFNGTIENSDNGTLLGQHVDNSCGIYTANCQDIIIKNLTVKNIYVRTRGSEQIGGSAWAIVFRSWNGMTKNIQVSNCIIHDAATGIIGEYSANCSNYNYSSNTIYNINHGIACPDRNSLSSLSNIVISYNNIYNFTNWDDTSLANSFHHNAIYTWSEQGGTSQLTDLFIFGNTFGPGLGGPNQTSLVYASGVVINSTIYNNVFTCNQNEYAACGFVYLLPWKSSSLRIYNNTFCNNDTGTMINLTANNKYAIYFSVLNNIGISTGKGTFICVYGQNPLLTCNINLNNIYNYDTYNTFSYSQNSSLNAKTFSQWQALGFDVDSSTNNPYLDQNLKPQSNLSFSVIGKGENLRSIFTTDKNNKKRRDLGKWDLGAVESYLQSPQNIGVQSN